MFSTRISSWILEPCKDKKQIFAHSVHLSVSFVSSQPSQEYEKQESISFHERTTDILVHVALLSTKLALSYKYTRRYCCKVSKFEQYTKKYNTVEKNKEHHKLG